MKYMVTINGEDPLELPDDYSVAQDFLKQTIRDYERDGQLPAWRAQAMMTHADNMPRAGFSFTVGVELFEIKRV